MDQQMDLRQMDAEIRRMKAAAEALNRMGENFPALFRNTKRILASIKMLEMNVSDVLLIDPEQP